MFLGVWGCVVMLFSSVVGYVSFLLLGYSYMMSDLLMLRVFVVGGLSVVVVF